MSLPGPRVIIATRLFAPEVGAASFRLRALATSLVGAGASPIVVTTRPPAHAGPAPDLDGVEVARARVLRDRSGNVRGYLEYLSFDIPLFFRLLVRRADVVVAEPPPTTGLVVAVSSFLRRRPFVYYAADVWTDGLIALGAPRPLIAIMRALEGWVLRKAARVIAVSDEVADKVREFGVDASRVQSTGNGIDTTLFTVDGPATSTVFPTFVYTGIMSEWQGPNVFVEALPIVRERYPDASIHFYGHGSEAERVVETATRLELDDAVVMHGVVPPTEAAAALRGATAALASISPGLGYDFAKPTKVYAAAACGTPIAFAGTGVAAKLVESEGLGRSAEWSPEAVAAAMISVADESSADDAPDRRLRRSAWVAEHASLAAVGRRAAEVALGAIGR